MMTPTGIRNHFAVLIGIIGYAFVLNLYSLLNALRALWSMIDCNNADLSDTTNIDDALTIDVSHKMIETNGFVFYHVDAAVLDHENQNLLIQRMGTSLMDLVSDHASVINFDDYAFVIDKVGVREFQLINDEFYVPGLEDIYVSSVTQRRRQLVGVSIVEATVGISRGRFGFSECSPTQPSETTRISTCQNDSPAESPSPAEIIKATMRNARLVVLMSVICVLTYELERTICDDSERPYSTISSAAQCYSLRTAIISTFLTLDGAGKQWLFYDHPNGANFDDIHPPLEHCTSCCSSAASRCRAGSHSP